MWSSILQRHFLSSRWKKYHSKIIFYSLSVFCGLKASCIWDFGPPVAASQIFHFVKDVKLFLKSTDRILVVVVDASIFITNASCCLKTLLFEKHFVEIKNGSFWLLKLNEKEYLEEMMKLLKSKLSVCDECELWELNMTDICCPPCFFGMLLNFPVVYCFDQDYLPFSAQLKVYTVTCEFKFEDVLSKFQVFSFSVPQSVLNADIDSSISSWFNGLQFSGKSIFSHLSLESSFEEVETLILCGLLKEAAHYFRKCINIDRYYIRAAHNLESVANWAVENWHFRMLNDEHRNEAFREAIIKKVRQGFHTVLDVGAGTGILSLFCAEGKANRIYACESSPIMAGIAERVFLSNNAHDITLIAKHSTDIQVPADIPQKVSLLVTETFDAGLLGEGILNTLSHAWQHLLLPSHPEPFNLAPDRFGLVLPFGASLFATGIQFDSIANDFHLKHTLNSLLFKDCSVFRNCDNYDTQDLTRTPHKCLTETEKVLELNFNDPKALAAISADRRQITFRCNASGRLDCFAVWFDLHLDDDIVLNTGPLSKNNAAWDQAIFPLRRSILVEKNQDLVVDIGLDNGRLNINFNEKCTNGPQFELSESAMRTLKNENLARGLKQAETKLADQLDTSVSVLDCYPFPVFGLNMLIRRSGRFSDKLTCFVTSEGDRRLVNFLAEKYGFSTEIFVKKEDDFGGFLQEEFDVMILDFVEESGEIKDGVLLELDRLKTFLKPNGIILPERVTVMAQFLHSDWLLRASKVMDDSVTCGYNIAEFINAYQTEHFIDLELNTIEKSACTEPFELFNLFDSLESITERTVRLRTGVPAFANAMTYWLKIRFSEGCDEILTNDDFFHQAAFLFPENEFFENINFNVIRCNGLFKIELKI